MLFEGPFFYVKFAELNILFVNCVIAQNKEGILPVATERAWLMWPNKLFRGRECTPLPQTCTTRCTFLVFNTQSNGDLLERFSFLVKCTSENELGCW